jgi:diketogulonate reductase-like aldo/keto reductase
MQFQQLGATGAQIAEIGIGTWGYRAGPDVLCRGLEAGALFIDTAESYETESIVGAAIASFRTRVFVATKVSRENLRPAELQRSADASLRRLGVERIDLYQVHAPNADVPIADTMGALAALVDAGKVRFIGVSNFSVGELEDAQRALGKHQIASNQVRYNIIDRTIENGLLQHCQANRITVIAYSPLAREFQRIRACDPEGVLEALARDTGRTQAQIALNWCLSHTGVVVIPKANSIPHMLENCAASGWRLSADQRRLLDEKIKYRHRGWFDAFVRRNTPRGLQSAARRAMGLLPAAIRRRVN